MTAWLLSVVIAVVIATALCCAVSPVTRRWLADGWAWLTDVARGRGCGTGLHVLPAGETPEAAPCTVPAPYSGLPCEKPAGHDLPHVNRRGWGWNDPDDEEEFLVDDLAPLPEYDEGIATRERYRRLAWAATGTTEAEYWARDRQPTNRSMGNWTPRDLAPHVVAALTGARPDETVIEHDHATLEPYIIGLAGGDPFDGLGQDEWLDRLFRAPAGVR